ncbi:leucine-rich_repeat domain-containing protein [Hexamita inflata]|uniref:Leucine-rich repeat domain-containing protein n=1 Tax=Hexamita inflata TaxID=28002 RepID=A0AA86QKJ5_9EUKA|nr:leucine-rich repeat domain-containing protein [Hexamita inflata]
MSTTFASKVNSNKFAQPAVLDETALKYKDCVRNAYLTISDDSSIANLNFAKQLNVKSLYLVQCFNITISQAVLVELSIVKCQLSSIQGIGQMKSLQKLNLSQNLIMDFSELSQLENLLHLNLSNSSLEEISFLSGLVKITHLNLNFNKISDISALTQMAQLTHLGINNNQLMSLVALQSCLKLEYVDYENNQIDIQSLNIIINLPKNKNKQLNKQYLTVNDDHMMIPAYKTWTS